MQKLRPYVLPGLFLFQLVQLCCFRNLVSRANYRVSTCRDY